MRQNPSETPYTTTRAIEFMEQAKGESWCLHLSYIKPHWPYIVPAPYHNMYSKEDVLPAVRSEAERADPHPLIAGYYAHRYSKAFSKDIVRETVIPAYMGLITQIDDQIGRIVQYLDASGHAQDTMIVFTSDHGDYLGDHWLGEKEMFHDPSVRVPLIVMDPSAGADKTRGTVNDGLTEAIDIVPTCIDFMGGAVADHILEGRSLMPFVTGEDAPKRDFVISEYDYSHRKHLRHLSPDVKNCLTTMVFDGRWKMVLVEGHRPMLYDQKTDPEEFYDLGADPRHANEIIRLSMEIFKWSRRQHNRVTLSDAQVEADRLDEAEVGVLLGFWDEAELAEWQASLT